MCASVYVRWNKDRMMSKTQKLGVIPGTKIIRTESHENGLIVHLLCRSLTYTAATKDFISTLHHNNYNMETCKTLLVK